MSSALNTATLYGGATGRRVTVRDVQAAKGRHEKWPMVTAYDAMTARVFDEAGIPVMLVGDSAAMVVYGYDSTLPVTVDDLIPLTAAVVRGSSRALVVADLPFGSYQASPQQALETAARFMKEAGAHAVKLEGRQPGVAAGRSPGVGRNPGHGAPGPDPPVGQRLRRLPRPGPGPVGRRADGRRQGSGARRRLLPGAWSASPPTWPTA